MKDNDGTNSVVDILIKNLIKIIEEKVNKVMMIHAKTLMDSDGLNYVDETEAAQLILWMYHS